MKTVFAVLVLVFSHQTLAEPWTIDSGNQQVTLIELYTSEGCSSCPRADRWISRFVDSDDLWRQVVPLSFHVDYWDYLGWKDRFSRAAFSERQRNHKQNGHLRAVYTPGTLVNGSEWRGLLEAYPLPARPDAYPGNLTLRRQLDQPEIFGLRFEGADQDNLVAHLVLVGTGLTTDVRRGENAGRILNHDFVVLEHQVQEGGAEWVFKLAPTPETTAVAAWITRGRSGKPVQAVGGWL